MVERQKLENETDYAYGVIDAIVEGMDKVTANPALAQGFVFELLKKMPELVDALMIVTKTEHRLKMAELVKASARMAAEWVKT
jgi:hypothetical protein